MTLIAAFRASDGLVMAADSRGTIGDPRGLTAINDTQVKLFKVTDLVGVATAGASEVAAQLLRELNETAASASLSGVVETVAAFRSICKSRYAEWFGGIPRENGRPGVNFIMAGYTQPTTTQMGPEPLIYSLSSQLDFAPQLSANGIALAGVPQYAIYLTHRLYDPGMSREHLAPLAAYVISETATQDPKVGGPIRISQIAKDSGYEELPSNEVDAHIRRNEEQNRRLREFFFGGEAHENTTAQPATATA